MTTLSLITAAFRAQSSFQDRIIVVTDAFQKMDHFYWYFTYNFLLEILLTLLFTLRNDIDLIHRSLQAWLMYRFDALSACSTFLLTLLALYTGVSPGLTAFVLVAASGCKFTALSLTNDTLY